MTTSLLRADPDEPTPRRRYALRTGMDGTRLLLARRAFCEGDVVLRFQGEVTPARRPGPALYLGAQGWLALDATAAAVRHACRPNAVLVEDESGPRLVALRTIRYGEALSYDHATWISRLDPSGERRCRCGAASCRRVVGSAAMLEEATRTAYLSHGGIPRHLRDELS